MKKPIVFLIILFISAFSLSVFAEQAALVLEFVNIDNETLKVSTLEQVREKMAEELERQNLDYESDAEFSSRLTIDNYNDSDTVFSIGQEAGVPVVLVVDAHEKEGLLELIITAWDVGGKQQISTERSVSKSEVTRYIMINSTISRIVGKLTGEYGIEIVQEEPKVRKITFLSNQEGMQVFLASGEYLGEIVHSVLTLTDREYEIGTKLLIVKELKGYRSGEQYIFLEKEKSVVPLGDLVKSQNIALEFNWTYTQLMGAGTGFRFYPVPDWMFISFDSYFYLQKDFSTPSGLEMTHSDIRLLAGLYLGFGPDSIFRINASLGFGFVLSYPLNSDNVYFDTYINAANISMELNFDNWSFYLRPELRFSLEVGGSSLHNGGILVSEWNIPQITVGVLRKW